MFDKLLDKIYQAEENYNKYPIEIEIEAENHALFSDPSSAPNLSSFPIPPFSQVLGIIKSIRPFKSCDIVPFRSSICNELRYSNFSYNYNGPLSKNNVIIHNTTLYKPIYRIYASPVLNRNIPKEYEKLNNIHCIQEMFLRKLKRGFFYRTPYFGNANFAPKYVGGFRESTEVNENFSCDIEAFPYVFYGSTGKQHIEFKKIKIVKGVLNYAQ